MGSFDPKLYTWAPSLRDPQVFHRKALSSENLWLHRPYSDRALYVHGSFRLHDTKGLYELEYKAKFAWRRLRFLHPEIALRGCPKERMLKYAIPTDDDEVFDWAERTMDVQTKLPEIKLENMLAVTIEKIERIWKNNNEPSEAALDQMAYLCLVTEKPKGPDKLVERIDFLFRFDHICTDGIGARILAGEFFKLLAEKLDPKWTPEWKVSVKNLMPTWIHIMNDAQVFDGDEYENAVQQQRQLMLQDMPRNPGLPFSGARSKTSSPRYGFHRHKICKTKSVLLLEKIHLLPQGTTLTHLTHASMVLAILRSNARSASDSAAEPRNSADEVNDLHSPCFLSARNCIQPTAICMNPTTGYIPICQALGDIIFPSPPLYDLPAESPPATLLVTLLGACAVARQSYLSIKDRKSILSESLPLMHELGDQIATQKDSKQSGLPKKKDSEPTRADPYLLSDGITNKYILPSYSSPSTPSANFSLSLLEVHFAAAPSSQNLIIRLSGWNDEITVAAEWKPQIYEKSMVEDFVHDIVNLMLLVTEE